jgi:hypothetical protein
MRYRLEHNGSRSDGAFAMTLSPLSALIDQLKAKRELSADDVLALRRMVFGETQVTPEEAEALILLDESVEHAGPEWLDLFVEALTDFVIHQQAPQGYVSEANAAWLVDRIGRDGRVKTQTELELLIRVLEKATSTPASLAGFALAQVKEAVLTAQGPLARGGVLVAGVVTAAEVELMRRILYAFGSDGNVAVTRTEAEVLFDINDASAGAANDPSWDELFVKAIANFLLAASHYQAPSRSEALRREQWLDAPSAGVMGFFRQMVTGGPAAVRDAYARPEGEDAWAARNAEYAAASRLAEQVTEQEARWLAERLGRDGAVTENERALLRFVKAEAASLHPALRSLVEKAA